MHHARIMFLLLAGLSPAVRAGVVINEIFYNAPDDLEDVQWIELYNTSDQSVDLGGWTLDDGRLYTFPGGTSIGPKGYLVVALRPDRFSQWYDGQAVGPLERPLERGGEKLHLKDGSQRLVDEVRYKDRPPWPVSPDGYSASLERICPTAPGDSEDNWAASPLPATPKPSGTPGRQNANFSAVLPPMVTLEAAPADVAPGQALRVEAAAKGKARELALLYRVVFNGSESKEEALAMTRADSGRFSASIPPQPAGSLIRYRVKVTGEDGSVRFCPAEHDLRPARSVYVHDKWETASIPLGLLILGGTDQEARRRDEAAARRNQRPGGFPGFSGRGPTPNFAGWGRREEPPRPPRGSSAFVYYDPAAAKTAVFDFINAVPRNNNRGFKIFLHKDHMLGDLRAVNLIFEGSEWSLLAEWLSYDLYRRAGCPASLSEFVRVWVDGRLLGYHLMVERVNRSFLRRNRIDEDGNLYKKRWMGQGVVAQHEKRTHVHTGHEDLLALLDALRAAGGNPQDQWKVIQDRFDVEQVASYFAVNMVLSHWDGFFNNYYAYHDTKRDKWQMYPWDQDKTWGYYDGLPDDQVFFDMPLTFGMAGDRPPGSPGNANPGGGFFGGGVGGPIWWRPGGPFSQPLLANPHFRRRFLARTRELLETVYTEGNYIPLIEELGRRLEEDARIRARLAGRDPETGARRLAEHLESLRAHLVKRRAFLLEQPELRP